MKNILLAMLLFAIGYSAGWAILHYLVDMSSYPNWANNLVSVFVPLVMGIGFVFSYPTFKKVV